MSGLTYRQAGVDIDEGERFVDRIRHLTAKTHIAETLGSVGGFAGLCRVPENLKDPVLVSGTDGVGTKLKLAFELDVHDTVGIDLVAMCVNDIITTGARPLFFLDYLAVGKLDSDKATRIVEGIATGCERAQCALLGGETAELPGMYAPDEYDLAGFAVGVVERGSMIDGRTAKAGDVVVGLRSSGLHSNGYSLARKALQERAGLTLGEKIDALGEPLGEALLRPTLLYVKAVGAALEVGGVSAFCHITGGGLPGNLPRVLPSSLGVELALSAWEPHPLFELIANAGQIEEREMRRTFNLGIGFVMFTTTSRASAVLEAVHRVGYSASVIGRVVEHAGDPHERVRFVRS